MLKATGSQPPPGVGLIQAMGVVLIEYDADDEEAMDWAAMAAMESDKLNSEGRIDTIVYEEES